MLVFIFLIVLVILFLLLGKKENEGSPTATLPETEITSEIKPEEKSKPKAESGKRVLLEVPAVCQFPDLPTGCESVSTAMVLNFYGETVTAKEFFYSWLTAVDFKTSGGTTTGPHPNDALCGNPDNALGCWAGAVEKAVNTHAKGCCATVLPGQTLASLCQNFIRNGKPIVVWATQGMKPEAKGKSWKLPSGENFTWITGEHCLVLVGYDDDFYYFNDPISGGVAAFEKGIAEKRFAALGSQALLITEKK